MLTYSPATGQLRHAPDLVLDPWHWTWHATSDPTPADAAEISMRDAVAQVHANARRRLVPVAIIGPRDPDPATRALAEQMGEAVGALGVPVLCGGKTGVMEAAAKGAKRAGALTIGIVPDNHWAEANDFIDLPLATGLGPARNVLVARMSLALVAVGGQYGTITEAAYGLHFHKPVFGLADAPRIEGVRQMDSVDAVGDALLPILLRLPDMS